MSSQSAVNHYLEQISLTARRAVQAKDWAQVRACAEEILKQRENTSEGHFLIGLFEKVSNRPAAAIKSFSTAISLDDSRYDAAIELAGQYLRTHQHNETFALLQQYESYLANSPRYLDMAGTIYTNIGLPEKGWPLYRRANELQPGADSLQASLAACSVYVGKFNDALDIYRRLLKKHPKHQRNHYELSRLQRATDTTHVEQMKAILQAGNLAPGRNIYIYYALGKELEDLEQWDEAFRYYKLAGDAAASVANYDVQTDVCLINKVIEVCNEDWMAYEGNDAASNRSERIPVFVVGLPRTGTTLIERILSSHSNVESVGETFFMQVVLKRESGIKCTESMNPAIVEAASTADIKRIAKGYRQAIAYKLGDKPMFIEKLPENYLYLGFIAKAFPQARIVHLNRNPMDTCFAMYKQSFFRYAYSLDDLAAYYVAFNRLQQHWRKVLGDRLVEVDYENLVADQEGRTRKLLEEIGLDFERACLNFEKSKVASNTASAVQVREKIHTRSVKRWKRYAAHLQTLQTDLERGGIKLS